MLFSKLHALAEMSRQMFLNKRFISIAGHRKRKINSHIRIEKL
jgi:hypothetical protein